MPTNQDRIDAILNLINNRNFQEAYTQIERLGFDEIEQIVNRCNVPSFKVRIIINYLPEERREKYIDTFSRDRDKLEIILSLSDDDVKAKYIEQFDSATDKSKIIMSFAKRDKLEYREYLKDAVIEGTGDKEILSILSNEDIKEILAQYDTETEQYIIFDIINRIPRERKGDFLSYISDEKMLLKILLEISPEVIGQNSRYIDLISNYIDTETDENKVIEAIKLLPKDRLTPEHIKKLEESISNGRLDDSTILYLIESKPEEDKIEYISKLLKTDRLSENIQQHTGWETIKTCFERAETDIESLNDVHDKVFNKLCLDYKVKVIDSMEWSSKKVQRITRLDNDEIIEKYINEFLNEPSAVQELEENFIAERSKNYTVEEQDVINNTEVTKIKLIGELSDEKQQEYINVIKDVMKKFDDEGKKNLLRYLSNEIIIELIDSIDEESYKYLRIEQLTEEQRANYITTHADTMSEDGKVRIIQGLQKSDLLKGLMFDKNIISNESISQLRRNANEIPVDFIKENLQLFIEREMAMYGQSYLKDIQRREMLIRQIAEENDDVWKCIDYRMLDERYVKLLGIDKIKVISAFEKEQQRILNLSDKKLNVLVSCINEHLKDTESSEWNIIGMDLLDKIESGQYDELINGIEDLSTLEASDIDFLTKLLQTNNVFEIKSVEDLRNYEQIKEQKCNELIASDDIENKRLAVLEKIFGQDIELTNVFIDQFNNIKELEDSGIKEYLESLKLIMSMQNPSDLEEIYNECQSITLIDKQFTTRTIKSEYAKQINKGLFNPQNAIKVEGEDNTYEAGTDFQMLICVQVTSDNSQMSHTLKDFSRGARAEWNMPSITSQFMATSYIRNDNIACFVPTFRLKESGSFIYGFYEMEPSSLLGMSPSDAGTYSHNLSPRSR